MAEEKSDFFHCPAYKLMISDIKSAVAKPPMCPQKSEGEHVEVDDDWYLKVSHLPSKTGQQVSITTLNPSSNYSLDLHLRLVWIQGTVRRIEKTDSDNLSLVIIDDDQVKEEAIIYEYNTVPGGDHPDIKIGAYIGTLGQIWSNNPVIVKATKVMYLSDQRICKSVWRDEVTLSKAFLAGLILPSLS